MWVTLSNKKRKKNKTRHPKKGERRKEANTESVSHMNARGDQISEEENNKKTQEKRRKKSFYIIHFLRGRRQVVIYFFSVSASFEKWRCGNRRKSWNIWMFPFWQECHCGASFQMTAKNRGEINTLTLTCSLLFNKRMQSVWLRERKGKEK